MLINFDIESAKLAVMVGSGKIVTRSGKEVEIVDWDTGRFPYSIVGNIIYSTYSELAAWTVSGRYLGKDKDCEYDLFIEEWI